MAPNEELCNSCPSLWHDLRAHPISLGHISGHRTAPCLRCCAVRTGETGDGERQRTCHANNHNHTHTSQSSSLFSLLPHWWTLDPNAVFTRKMRNQNIDPPYPEYTVFSLNSDSCTLCPHCLRFHSYWIIRTFFVFCVSKAFYST